MKKLKICNIKNLYETRSAATLGVDYLGYHLISESDFNRSKEIKNCISELRDFYPKTKSVLVTKEKNIEILEKTIDLFEFDAVQLHYEESKEVIAHLRGKYGDVIEIFQVLTVDSSAVDISAEADYHILDKSFLGGTGKEIGLETIENYIKKLGNVKLFLAGGLSPENVHKYINLEVLGFDIQSGMKADITSEYENTSFIKIKKITTLLGKELQVKSNQIGFAIQDINQKNSDLLKEAIAAGIDFFHLDISDGFIADITDLTKTVSLISGLNELSSHFPIHYHFFTKSFEKFIELNNELWIDKLDNAHFFVHINRDNYKYFTSLERDHKNIFFALDVKDLIDESFPWENFVKESLLICFQSESHAERIDNYNKARKMINYSTKKNPMIIIDRSISIDVVEQIDQIRNLSIVSGSYLKQDINKNYNILKNYLNERIKYEKQ